MSLNTELFFGKAGNERGTPQDFFDAVNARYQFTLDVAAGPANHKCELWLGEGGLAFDALEVEWAPEVCWMNPPFSLAGAFVAKAHEEAQKGAVVVGLLPCRTEAKWWHAYVWDRSTRLYYPGVSVEFTKGRLSFDLFVPPEIRAAIKDLEGPYTDEEMTMKDIVDLTGLPKMAIKGIWLDKEDDDLLGNAPFPTCLVEWRKP